MPTSFTWQIFSFQGWGSNPGPKHARQALDRLNYIPHSMQSYSQERKNQLHLAEFQNWDQRSDLSKVKQNAVVLKFEARFSGLGCNDGNIIPQIPLPDSMPKESPTAIQLSLSTPGIQRRIWKSPCATHLPIKGSLHGTLRNFEGQEKERFLQIVWSTWMHGPWGMAICPPLSLYNWPLTARCHASRRGLGSVEPSSMYLIIQIGAFNVR